MSKKSRRRLRRRVKRIRRQKRKSISKLQKRRVQKVSGKRVSKRGVAKRTDRKAKGIKKSVTVRTKDTEIKRLKAKIRKLEKKHALRIRGEKRETYRASRRVFLKRVVRKKLTRRVLFERKLRKRLRAQFAQMRETKRIAKLKNQFEKAMSKFGASRPSERDSFVFVSLKGERLPFSDRRKGYVLYITKSGKRVRQLDYGDKRVYYPPRKSASWDLIGSRRKVAVEKFLKGRETLKCAGSIKATPKELKGNGLDYYRFVRLFAPRFERCLRVSITHRRSVDIKFAVIVDHQKERLRTHYAHVSFSQVDLRQWPVALYERVLGEKIYPFIAEALGDRSLVSKGSSEHIRRLKINRGKSRKNWMTGDGAFRWGKNDFEDVRLLQIDWEIYQILYSKEVK